MKKQLSLFSAAQVPVRGRRVRQKALPGNEGITWDRCSVCGRPIFDAVSRARKMGHTCLQRKKQERDKVNFDRQQRELGNQLSLLSEPVYVPAA